MLTLDQEYYDQNELLTGIDEAGRGPLAGPLVVCAVTVSKGFELSGLNDSKKLTDKKRRALYDIIIKEVMDYSIEIIPVVRIDEINILAATMEGMTNAFKKLDHTGYVLIDGNRIPKGLLSCNAEAVVKGDGNVSAIAAASILAKVTRDDIMLELDKKYPEYDFSSNKGYGTQSHMKAIRKFGIRECHRKSYKPVSQMEFSF